MEKSVLWALALIGLALAVLFSLSQGIILLGPHPKVQNAVPAPAILPPDPMPPAALSALNAFFEAPDLASKAALVRDPARVLPMMKDYHNRREHALPTLGRVSPGRAVHFGETPMVLFEVEPFSGPRYPVAVVWDGHRFAIDWESLTAYGTMEWSEFVETQPATVQTLRVYVQNASEAQQIPDVAAGFKAFRIEHRDDPQAIVAIADVDMASILAPLVEKQRAPVTLEIAWRKLSPSGLSVPEIRRLVAPRWSP